MFYIVLAWQSPQVAFHIEFLHVVVWNNLPVHKCNLFQLFF